MHTRLISLRSQVENISYLSNTIKSETKYGMKIIWVYCLSFILFYIQLKSGIHKKNI